ncbi:hypothetical protein [Cellulosimicrobium marinum]|uniref:hypothetical protein n=1 Tax=Cellulosimicrobium marinum TaxID=1638992 RepID=UPI001E45B639|nr:hypothetical protein [Cellulosimicrobium marinum]MCB7136692.1 hypothetical protein [Cellulosimicrobium marinum]
MNRTHLTLAALCAVSVLALSGCGLFGGGAAQDATPGAAATDGAAADPGPGGTDAPTARVADAVLAEQTLATPTGGGAPMGGELTVTVRALEVQDETMTLRWALRWDNDDLPDDAAASYNDMGVDPVATVTDPANLVAYRPFCTEGAWQPDTESVTDAGLAQLECRRSMLVSPLENITFGFPNHGTVEAYAVLPAPTERVDSLDVLPAQGLPAFTDVTVTYLDDDA